MLLLAKFTPVFLKWHSDAIVNPFLFLSFFFLSFFFLLFGIHAVYTELLNFLYIHHWKGKYTSAVSNSTVVLLRFSRSPKVVHVPLQKNHPYAQRKAHVNRILLVLLKPNTNFFLNVLAEIFICLPTCLTTFESLEAKQHNSWPTNFATITNSPVRCAFSGSNKYLPSATCYSFYLHNYGRLLHVTKPYRLVNYLNQHSPY